LEGTIGGSGWDGNCRVNRGYCYRIPKVAPSGQGNGFQNLKDFQDRSYDLHTLVFAPEQGTGLIKQLKRR
jgi:hypothetical protein